MSEAQRTQGESSNQLEHGGADPVRAWQEELIRISAWPPSENPNPVLQVRADGRILSANPPGDDLLRLSEASSEFVPESWRRIITDCLESNQRREAEFQVADRALLCVFAPIMGLNFLYIFGCDITERKNAERALRESEERFRQLAENIQEVFWLLDWSSQRLVYVSPAYETIWGRSADSLYKNPGDWIEAIHPEDRRRVEQVFFNGAATGGFDEEYRILRPDGSSRWIRDRGFPIRNEAGEVYRIAGLAEDCSARKRIEEAFRSVVENTAAVTGKEFFGSLARQLSAALEVRFAFVAECRDQSKESVEMLAFWAGDRFCEPVAYEVAATPCEKVLEGVTSSHHEGVQRLYPKDEYLVELGAQSYVGVPIFSGQGTVIGHLVVMDDKAMDEDPHRLWILKIFAARAGAELERKRAEAALRYSRDLENLMTEVSTQFINLPPAAIEDGIHDALKRIGEFVGVDRSYVFLSLDNLKTASNTHEWCAEGISSVKEQMQNVPSDLFPWFLGFLSRGEALHVPSVSELPPEAHLEREMLEAQQVLSLVAVPIAYEGFVTGLVGFDCVRKARSWSEDVVKLLKMVGVVFANALRHKWDQEALEQANEDLERKVEERTRELRRKQAQLVQSEKMASLGQLVAGVAHEINTPLGALQSNTDLVARSISRVRDALEKGAEREAAGSSKLIQLLENVEGVGQVSQTALERITSIVSSLRSFARLDQAIVDEVDIHEGLDSTLTLVEHQLEGRIRVHRDYAELPVIACRPNQLNQVYMNILVNAIQAIPGQGDIWISTSLEEGRAVVEIADNGVGIPQEHLSRIFDPGFTTKGVKVGTGIGLSIVYRIVEDHGGNIDVESQVGKGTKFTIVLPIQPEA